MEDIILLHLSETLFLVIEFNYTICSDYINTLQIRYV